MKLTIFTFRQITALSALMFLVGCATVKSAPTTGFLSDYSGLVEIGDEKGLKMDVNRVDSLGKYSKFIIAPIAIYLHEDSKAEAIDATQLKELTDYFHEKLNELVTEKNTVVDEPGEGVAVIRLAVTDFRANIQLLNIHWATSTLGHGIGGASLEAEIIDSITKERIFAITDTRKGDRFFEGMTESDTKIRNAAQNYGRGLTKWGQTKNVFDEWSRMLAKQINGEEAQEQE